MLFVVGLSLVGMYAAGFTAKKIGVHDHQSIVIDEIIGMLVALFLCPLGWVWVGAAFVLFRLFDILKPWPISTVDKNVSGGFGIVLDDLLAGIYTFIVIQTMAYLTL